MPAGLKRTTPLNVPLKCALRLWPPVGPRSPGKLAIRNAEELRKLVGAFLPPLRNRRLWAW